MLVFVYGSLRNGFHNHVYLKDAEFIGNFQTLEKFYMYSYRSYSYPYIIREKLENSIFDPVQIKGEVYKIDETILKRLDILEGNPDFYKRQSIYVESLSDSKNRPNVEIYVIENKEIIEEVNNLIESSLFIEIPHGDWRRAIEEKDQKPYLPYTGR